jgi:hypothetical protein
LRPKPFFTDFGPVLARQYFGGLVRHVCEGFTRLSCGGFTRRFCGGPFSVKSPVYDQMDGPYSLLSLNHFSNLKI